MTLVLILVVPIMAGALAWATERVHRDLPRWIAVAALAVDGLLMLRLWPLLDDAAPGGWIAEVSRAWVPGLGIRFHLAVDGLSLVMLLLTAFLGLVAVVASWRVDSRIGLFHANLLWVLAGVCGVFMAMDLILFYVVWELMLVPMVLLIALWGYGRRWYAAIKFFVYTQAGGLLMLVAIVALALIRARGGELSFAYADLLGTELSPTAGLWLMAGFLAAFAVKLPAFPVHGWLPDAHTQAPTAGSVVLAGLLLKTGAYGILRFAIPLFPDAAKVLAPAMMALGAIGILYGAVLAFAQSDVKRLVAYTSVSHLGFVLVGAFAFHQLAVAGSVVQMVAHGLSTGALFVLAGILSERTGTRDFGRLGGLWTIAPRMAVAGLFFALASLGLPGTGNFVAEILVLLGAFKVNVGITALATFGLVLATVYSLRLMHGVFLGPNREGWEFPDVDLREGAVLLVMALVLLWIGLYPSPILDAVAPAVDAVVAAGGGAG